MHHEKEDLEYSKRTFEKIEAYKRKIVDSSN
jgi:hypothetical protein